jgi:hypothetical protein
MREIDRPSIPTGPARPTRRLERHRGRDALPRAARPRPRRPPNRRRLSGWARARVNGLARSRRRRDRPPARRGRGARALPLSGRGLTRVGRHSFGASTASGNHVTVRSGSFAEVNRCGLKPTRSNRGPGEAADGPPASRSDRAPAFARNGPGGPGPLPLAGVRVWRVGGRRGGNWMSSGCSWPARASPREARSRRPDSPDRATRDARRSPASPRRSRCPRRPLGRQQLLVRARLVAEREAHHG